MLLQARPSLVVPRSLPPAAIPDLPLRSRRDPQLSSGHPDPRRGRRNSLSPSFFPMGLVCSAAAGAAPRRRPRSIRDEFVELQGHGREGEGEGRRQVPEQRRARGEGAGPQGAVALPRTARPRAGPYGIQRPPCRRHQEAPVGGTDWHAVLDVPPTAGTDAIKKKFKRLCLLTHPDKNPSVAADGAFKLVVRAWDAISSSSSSSAASAAASCESQSSGFESRRRSTRSDSGSGFTDGAKKPSTGRSSSSSNSNANSGSGPQPGRSAASQESFDGSCGATHVVPYCLHCGANSGLRFTFERSGFLDVRIICPSCKKMYRCHMGIRLSS
uniref:J domain-containing protein n=1 Tax=Ananas comosus var. bracteatus TaxID=296719 RepID=A0A6V7PFV3_ANACO|nr:unnamed protein product [Ananas comosus var. bracteatus]